MPTEAGGGGMKPGIDALQALPLLGGFPTDRLASLNETADLARIGPDETLFRPGDLLTELNFLAAGQIGATRLHRDGQLALVDVLLPPGPLCLPAAWLGLPAPIGAQTLTSVRLIVLPVRDLRAIIDTEPALALPFLNFALFEAHELARDIGDLKLRSSAQRLARYLLDLSRHTQLAPARFVLPFEKRLLAAKIGCSQENLSRAFAALRRLGVETQATVVVLRDVPALRAFAGPPRAHPAAD